MYVRSGEMRSNRDGWCTERMTFEKTLEENEQVLCENMYRRILRSRKQPKISEDHREGQCGRIKMSEEENWEACSDW